MKLVPFFNLSDERHSGRRTTVFLLIFPTLLLCIGLTLKSWVIIDMSLLPRFLFVDLLILVFTIIRFRKVKDHSFTFFDLAFILFIAWNLISSSWATCASEALMQSSLLFLSYAIYLTISSCIRTDARFETVFTRILMVVLLYSFILAFITINSLDHYNPYRIISVSANNNLYSGFLLICLPFAFSGYARESKFWKYLSLLVAVLSIFFIIIVQSRAVYLGLFVSLVISTILVFARYPHVLTKKNIITGLAAMILLATGVGIFYSCLDNTRRNYFLSKIPVWAYFRSYDDVNSEKAERYKNTTGKLEKMASFDFSEDYYENANLRIIFWKKSWGLIKSNPVAGVGSGNWRIAVPSVPDPPNPDHTFKNYTYSYPHNEWIGILAELGIIGFILSLFIFIIPVGTVFRKIIMDKATPDISVLFYVSFILGFYVFASFDFPLKRIEHNVILFSAFAFLFSRVPLRRISFHREDAKTQKGIRTMAISLRLCAAAVNKNIATGFFTILLGFSAFIATERLKGEYYTLKMFRDERVNDMNVIHLCGVAENAFYHLTPNTLPLAWFEGVAWFRLGETDRALNAYRRALTCTPYEVRVLNDYAVAYFQMNRVDEAKSLMLRAYRIDPWFDDLKFNLAAVYYFASRRDSAVFYVNSCRESQKKRDYLRELK